MSGQQHQTADEPLTNRSFEIFIMKDEGQVQSSRLHLNAAAFVLDKNPPINDNFTVLILALQGLCPAGRQPVSLCFHMCSLGGRCSGESCFLSGEEEDRYLPPQ